MTLVSKNVYILKLDDIVNNYSNTYHKTIKMKPVDVKNNTYINTDNDKDPKFQVGNHVRISKYQHIFAKGNTPNWSKDVSAVKEIKDTVAGTYIINDLNSEQIIGKFYEDELQKQTKKSLE